MIKIIKETIYFILGMTALVLIVFIGTVGALISE